MEAQENPEKIDQEKSRDTTNSDVHLNNFEEENEIIINNKKRIIIFIILFIIATLSSLDGGIVPQQNENIKKDFGGDNEDKVGLFGSIDYIGRVVGSIIYTLIMGRMNRKIILVITLIFKSITLIIPLIVKNNYEINLIARALSGLSQVFYPIYLPVWCDQYAKKKFKAIWVTIVQIGNPIGIILGYGLGMMLENFFSGSGWVYSFLIEGISLAVCAILVLFFDKIYFSENFVLSDDSKGKEMTMDKTIKIFKNLRKIICNKIFIFSCLFNSVCFFGIGVVQFYGDKYMNKVLKIDSSIRFILFGLLCLFGPTSGMVFGGVICSKLGGYEKKNSMTFTIISMAIATVISMIIACHEISVLFIITGWTFLFGIGAAIPPISGIIISCLDNNLRGDGFSICNLLNNLIGSFPSSYVYALLVDAFKKEKEEDRYRYAWMITMGYNFIGLMWVIIAGIFRYKIKGDLSEKKEEKNNLIDDEKNNEVKKDD